MAVLAHVQWDRVQNKRIGVDTNERRAKKERKKGRGEAGEEGKDSPPDSHSSGGSVHREGGRPSDSTLT